jgi:hypothetical protein
VDFSRASPLNLFDQPATGFFQPCQSCAIDCCFGRKDYAVTGYDVNLTRIRERGLGFGVNLDFITFNFPNSHNRIAKRHPLHVWAFQSVQKVSLSLLA